MESKTTTEELSIPTVDDHHSATIIHNASNHTMIVFQERAPTGIYSNIQVLQPGEAVIMTRQQSTASSSGASGAGIAGGIAGGIGNVANRVLTLGAPPLTKFHAIVGDESCLSSLVDESTQNLVKNAAIPAAFIVGCLVTAIAAGTLAGPSIALAPLVSGVVLNGVVVDTAAVAAGTVLATRAKAVTEMLNKDKPTEYAAKTKGMKPFKRGNKGRYLVVSGGLSDGAVTISEIGSKEKFEKKYTVSVWKRPLENCRSSNGGGSGRKKIWRIGNNNKNEPNKIVESAVVEEG